eukprot:3440922-Rhodomonas_salina.3
MGGLHPEEFCARFGNRQPPLHTLASARLGRKRVPLLWMMLKMMRCGAQLRRNSYIYLRQGN